MQHLTQPLTIRNITIPNRIVMSPMTGYTDPPFRRICAELGAKVLFSEMIHTGCLIYGSKKTRARFIDKTGDYFFAIQLLGSNPEHIKKAAYIISQEEGFGWIDINMGCPVRKVIKEGAGAALMLNLDLAREIIRAARAVHSGILSVKMRTGWSQNSKNAPELCKIAVSEGVDLITVHGRTREEFYTGAVDFDLMAKIKKLVSVPIFGNGGLMKARDVKNMVDNTGVDGVMLARGAFGNPWIFRQIEEMADVAAGFSLRYTAQAKACGYNEKKEVFLRHARYLAQYHGENKAMPLIQKFAVFYFKGVDGAAHMRGEIYKTDNLQNLFDVVDEYI